MARVILFRLWNPFSNDYLYDVENVFQCLSQQNVNDGIQKSIFRQTLPFDHAKDGFVWEQFTGQKDKNGVDIYEGDITKSIHKKMISNGVPECDTDPFYAPEIEEREYFNQIDWFEGVKISGWRIKGKRFQAQLKWSTVLNMKLEVVGNIHQNTELLKT